MNVVKNAIAEVRLFVLNLWWAFFPPEVQEEFPTHYAGDPDILYEIERLARVADDYTPTTTGLPEEVLLVEYEIPEKP